MFAVTSRTLAPVCVVSNISVIVSLALLFLTNWRAPLLPLRSSNSVLIVYSSDAGLNCTANESPAPVPSRILNVAA